MAESQHGARRYVTRDGAVLASCHVTELSPWTRTRKETETAHLNIRSNVIVRIARDDLAEKNGRRALRRLRGALDKVMTSMVHSETFG